MAGLTKIACAIVILSGLPMPGFAAEADTERGQTPAAPAAAGADNQPNKPPTAVMSNGATTIRKGSKEEERATNADQPEAARPEKNN
jgi:hypothetical protein